MPDNLAITACSAYQVRRELCEILHPHELSNLFRALRIKPRNREYERYLNTLNYIFQADKLRETFNNTNCRFLIIGKDVELIKAQVSVVNEGMYDNTPDRFYEVCCISLCFDAHEYHRVNEIIQRHSMIGVYAYEFKIPRLLTENYLEIPALTQQRPTVLTNGTNHIVCIPIFVLTKHMQLDYTDWMSLFAHALPNVQFLSYISDSDDFWNIESANMKPIMIHNYTLETPNSNVSSNTVSDVIIYKRFEMFQHMRFFEGFKLNF